MHDATTVRDNTYETVDYRKELLEKELLLIKTIEERDKANEEIRNRENEKSILLSLGIEIAAVRNKDDLFHVLNTRLRELFSVEGFGINILSEDRKTHSSFLISVKENISGHENFRPIIDAKHNYHDGIVDVIMNTTGPVLFDVSTLPEGPDTPTYVPFWKKMNIQVIVGVAMNVGDNPLGCLLFHLDPNLVGNLRYNLLKGVCALAAIGVSNIVSNEKIAKQLDEIRRYKEQLEDEKQYLQEEISNRSYSDIIGNGPAIQQIFQQLEQVSFANSTVLITGETGTGKELIARAIHNSSPRRNKLMVKINCAAMPVHLIESELFGHEKGSFTGAIERRIGKFELANEGTLFLDEIGEMPQDLQVKLLRAIQEKEIERIGGKTTIKVNVRIIAATNRNLQKEVDEGKFRADLYYRLNVFPVVLPPLRERREDIPILVSHFISKYAKSSGKQVTNISGKAMKELMAYSWPGNIRELEHLIERTILTNAGPTIKEVHLPDTSRKALRQALEDDYLKTWEENERDHIIRVLNKCNGKVYGPGGAAEILDLPVSTLNSRIKKLGIEKKKRYT